MPTQNSQDPVSGKTIRLAWSEGPTKGSTHEHKFFADGTVEWHAVKSAGESSTANGKKREQPERPRYSAFKLDNDICLFSYLSKSGYTLTVTLNFADHSTAGFASNESTWTPLRGQFEIVR